MEKPTNEQITDYVRKKRRQRELKAKMSELQKKQMEATMPDSVKYADGGDVNLSEAELNRFGGEITQEDLNRAQQDVANRQLEVATPELEGYGDDPYLSSGLQDTILEYNENKDRNNVINPEYEGGEFAYEDRQRLEAGLDEGGEFAYEDRQRLEAGLDNEQNEYADGGAPETNRFQDMLTRYRGLRDPEKEAQMQEQIAQEELAGGIGKFASRLGAAFVPGQKATAADDFKNYSADSRAKLKQIQGQPDKDMAGVLRMAQMEKALAPTQKKPTDFTLSEGQKRYDAKGNIIASGPEKKTKDDKGFTLSEGQTRFDKQGKILAEGLKKKGGKYVVSRDKDSEASKRRQTLAKELGVFRQMGITDEQIDMMNEAELVQKAKAWDKKLPSQHDLNKLEETTAKRKEVEDRSYRNLRKSDEKEILKAQKELTGVVGARSNVAKSLMRESLSRDGLRVIEMIRKDNLVPTEQVAEELATVLASTLMGGNQPTRESIKGIIPDTLHGDVNAIKQWIMGQPKEFLNKEFLKHFEHQLKGQQKFWSEELSSKEKSVAHMLKPIFNRKRSKDFVNQDLMKNFGEGIDILESSRNIDDTVIMVAPNGEEMPVKKEKIQKYLDKGAKVKQ